MDVSDASYHIEKKKGCKGSQMVQAKKKFYK
jgi:hypothetical protein